jgi:hypothetical protein
MQLLMVALKQGQPRDISRGCDSLGYKRHPQNNREIRDYFAKPSVFPERNRFETQLRRFVSRIIPDGDTLLTAMSLEAVGAEFR